MPVIIVENDESQWDDATGETYHFPGRYLKYLQPGTAVIYYKGKQRDSQYANVRLNKNPHYFGVAVIGKVTPDANSLKGDQFCEIANYRSFEHAVPASNPYTKETLEVIPDSRASNFWRDGIRPCSQEVFDRIIAASGLSVQPKHMVPVETNDDKQGTSDAYETIVEDGRGLKVYGTRYERNPRLRARALQLHGFICKGCGFDFEKVYGTHGRGYIHVHHLNPISSTGGMMAVNPLKDMTVLCANCHSMVHRYPKKMLSLLELQAMVPSKSIRSDAVPDVVYNTSDI